MSPAPLPIPLTASLRLGPWGPVLHQTSFSATLACLTDAFTFRLCRDTVGILGPLPPERPLSSPNTWLYLHGVCRPGEGAAFLKYRENILMYPLLGPGASFCSISKNGYPHLAMVLPVWDVSEWTAWPAHSPEWRNTPKV